VRRAVDAFRRRDASAVGELFDAEAVFRSAIVGGIEGGTYRGHADIEQYFSDMDEAFEDWHTENERFFETGDGRVVLVYRIKGRGKGSGVPIDQQVGIVFGFRDGKIVLGEIYLDPQEALAAAGVREAA
jgi:ketosteroid isomerase-like protein